MARACADVRKSELLQDLAHRALVIDDAEALGDDALQVDAPPAHDLVQSPVRAGLDEFRQRRLLLCREARRRAFLERTA
jgi:hypothetical protein